MTNIYDQHRAAFSNVSAYVIMKDNERVATLAFKFPKDGAGRLYAYVHWLGLEMVASFASGYGYDKRSAACEDAIAKLKKVYATDVRETDLSRIAFIKALENVGGNTWDRALTDAGFVVLQAV